MSLPDVTSREQWLEARRRLLAQEKELTRSRDALNASRRRLPMVKVDQESSTPTRFSAGAPSMSGTPTPSST